MDKIGIVRQRAGVGDCFFCLKIAQRMIRDFGCSRVYWPVAPIYDYLSQYIESPGVLFEEIQMPDSFHIIHTDELLFVPLDTCDMVSNYPDRRANGHMKYDFFYQTDFMDWKDHFTLKRNYKREMDLVKKLGINLAEDYNFVSRNFGTPPNYVTHRGINVNNGLPNIYMELMEGVNIFDWLTIADHAKEIHTCDGALHYLLDKIGLENVTIYSRYRHANPDDKDDFSHMKIHSNPNWKYV